MAVNGMLPKSKTRRDVLSRLKVYEGANHPHFAQFKIDVRKTVPDDTIYIPRLADRHQTMLDYWRAMGDDGVKQFFGDKKVVFEVDEEKKKLEGKETKKVADKK